MEKLVIKAKKGDSEAFMEAINKCSNQLYKIGKTMMLSDEDVGDIIQETILVAYKKINTLKEPAYFKTWLIRIFMNKCNYLKKQNSKIIFIEDINSLNKEGELGATDLELREAINNLKNDNKEVIILFYIMGYSIKEISSILEVKEGTIKSRLCRARNDLRISYGIQEEVK